MMPKSVIFYSEGVKLAGDLFLPADIKPGERRAGIVLCHGYTGVRSIYLPDNARVLADAGYVVLTFDYKGWGDSDGAKTRLAPYSRVADVQAALTFMGAQPEGGRRPPRYLRHQLRRRDRGLRRRHRSAGQMRGFGGRHRQRSTLDAERAPPGRVP
jgi:predicted alpha/beta hydrolase